MELNINAGQRALITTNNWFLAPDGIEYKAVFGTVKAIRSSEVTLGVQTNRNSANWYVEIGNMTIAGCQIYYAVRTDECYFGPATGWSADATNGIKEYSTPTKIYNADREI